MRRYRREIDDAVLIQHYRANLTDDQIAFLMKLTAETVTNHRQRLKLTRESPRKKPLEPEPPHIPVDTCPVTKAKRELGSRLTEKNGCYYLDGRLPVGINALIAEANRIRAVKGLKPIILGPSR